MITIESHPALILKEKGMAPLKSLGQNFLINTHSLENILDTIDLTDKVVEIGPGLGKITDKLIKHSNLQFVIEKDKGMTSWLHEQFPDLTIFNEDFLKLDSSFFRNCNFLISNLPFYITSLILEKTVKNLPMISKFVFGMQKEVGERLVLGKGSSLAIFMAVHGQMKILGKISRNSFYPIPEVDAVWLQWSRRKPSPFVGTTSQWELLLRGSFWGKRKKLLTSWKKNPFWQSNKSIEIWNHKLNFQFPEKIQLLVEKRADQITLTEYSELLVFLNS